MVCGRRCVLSVKYNSNVYINRCIKACLDLHKLGTFGPFFDPREHLVIVSGVPDALRTGEEGT